MLPHVFPRLAPAACVKFASVSDWFIGLSVSFMFRQSGDIDFGFTTLN